ncbi:hypothetical protein [Azohydromonas caseinilytica]|uniref:PEP-CTERM protein-sorting domain-containing protein n=1 Tax=Azohydromonas caseinilytica TaxID=2728836 RepID=A0A848FEK7_9BURK|nr:hypothetical protein [Azohydromonas caseinilytica]NML17265.1 hypothetical protein [Azohydromonas caseinilytica]
MRKSILSLAAALACALVQPVRADIRADLRIENFGYTLIDLDPNDGITPHLDFSLKPDSNWSSGAGAYSKYEYMGSRAPGQLMRVTDNIFDGFKSFIPLSSQVVGPTGRAATDMGGSIHDRSFNLNAQVSSLNAGNPDQRAHTDLYASVGPSGPGSIFGVTPHTQVIWTGDLSMRLEKTLDPGFEQLEEIHGYWSGYTDLDHVQQQTLTISSRENPGERLYQSAFSLSFINDTATSTTSFVSVSVTASGSSNVVRLGAAAPVPEPAGVLLMLCGLGVVAGWSVRARHVTAA